MDRKLIARLALISVLLLGLVGASLVVKTILLNGVTVVRLAPASSLAGVISQSLSPVESSNNLPQEGEDYTLSGTRYFYDKDWVVSVIQAKAGDKTVLVLQSKDGIYYPVLGPGSAFPQSSLQNLPQGVKQYVTDMVASYEPLD
jgi:hypothetical protein